MSTTRENAKQAMRELFGTLSEKTEEVAYAAAQAEAAPEVQSVEQTQSVEDAQSVYTPHIAPEEPIAEAVQAEEIPVSATLVSKAAPLTVIGEDTQIIGTIKTANSLELYGFVKGDIVSESDVFLYGKVNGNVSGSNVFLNSGAVKGDISSDGQLRISQSSAVAGNVKCSDITIDGKLLGNITATQSTELLDNALILGDINTSRFSMSDTSRLQGVINLNARDNMAKDNFDAYFDF